MASVSGSSSASSRPSLITSLSSSSSSSPSETAITTATSTYSGTSSSVIVLEAPGALSSELDVKTMTIIYASSIPVAFAIGVAIVGVYVIRARRKKREEEFYANANVDKSVFSKLNPMHQAGFTPGVLAAAAITEAAGSSSSAFGTIILDNNGVFGESESKDEFNRDGDDLSSIPGFSQQLRIRSPSFNRHQFGKHQSFERGYLSETIKAWETAQNNDQDDDKNKVQLNE